ncbi:MAG TPA: tubulin-like doman-containing protein [Gemmataceae bacterium]|nr:tubulin-like doman-containing protein [Gemmataceae bacterium]
MSPHVPDAMDPLILPNAEPIPGYKLIERLGRGGYGEVWKASAPGGIHKAIKFVYGDMEGVGGAGQGAEQEFRSLNRVKSIRHPYILSIDRFDIINGRLTIVTELADKNLWDRYSECVGDGLPGIPRDELLRYMEEAAEALDLMNYHHGLQHLDVKPHNIFLVHSHVKVADFGLAKDLEGARTNVTGGVTPTYAPPETFDGWVSRQSDQYSLAIVYQEMLTGQRPFTGSNTRQLILQHMTGVPDLASLPPPDRDPVARALAKAPTDRFKTCGDFINALKAAGTARRSGAAAPGFAPATDTPTASMCDTAPSTAPGADALRKALPPLVTRKTKSTLLAAVTHLRRSAPDTGVLSRPGPAPPERLGDGLLIPALVIGIGETGLATLRRLRRLVLDRFGAATLPHLRWLFVDTDPAAIEDAVTGSPAFHPEEVLLARLHRPAHYLTRDGLPSVDSWLNPEDLYRMPKTPATNGVRAIGRLALCDHHHAICLRIRSAVEAFVKPEPLAAADRQTGLGQRSNYPRVYIAASLAGGTGSGMFLDMAFLARRELRHIGFKDSQVTGLFAMPVQSPHPAAAAAVSNTRAAMSELSYYYREGTVYETLFDVREKPVTDAGTPFRRCAAAVFRPNGEIGTTTRMGAILAHTAFAELLTPMGKTLQPDDGPDDPHPFGFVGVGKLVWPRKDILRAAGSVLARTTLQRWLTRTLEGRSRVPGDVVAAEWNDRHLDRTGLRRFLSDGLNRRYGRPLDARVDEVLAAVADVTGVDGKSVARVHAAFEDLQAFLGRPGADEAEFPHQVGALIAATVSQVTADADRRLLAAVGSLIEQPGLRIAGAEEALGHFRRRIDGELDFAEDEARLFDEQAFRQFLLVQAYVDRLGRDGVRVRPAGEAADELRQWAIARFQGLVARACANVYRVLRNNLPEFTREVSMCRAQLADYVRALEAERESDPVEDGVQVNLFDETAGTAAEAAAGLVSSLTPDELAAFESGFQERVQRECRGVVTACVRPSTEGGKFKLLIVDEAVRFLDARLERRPASHVLLDKAEGLADLDQVIRTVVETAQPIPAGSGLPQTVTQTVLGIPPDEDSAALRAVVRDCAGGETFAIAADPSDLFVVRESRGIPFAQLPYLRTESNTGLPGAAAAPPKPAHSRQDIMWSVFPSS